MPFVPKVTWALKRRRRPACFERHLPNRSADHGNRLAPHLIPVAIGAVMDENAPAVAQPREVGKLIRQPHRHQQRTSDLDSAVIEVDGERASPATVSSHPTRTNLTSTRCLTTHRLVHRNEFPARWRHHAGIDHRMNA